MKKELIIPIIIAGLTIAFVVVSALVWLSRGNAGLISKKLKLGALLLTFTSITNFASGQEYVSCYIGPPRETDNGMNVGVNLGIRYSGQNDMTYIENSLFKIPDEKETIGITPVFGINYEYLFTNWRSENQSSISANLNFTFYTRDFSNEIESASLINEYLTSPVEYLAELDFSYLHLDILFNFSTIPNLFFSAGFSPGVYLSKSGNLYLMNSNGESFSPEILDDNQYTLEENNKKLVLKNDDMPELNKFNIDIVFGMKYDFHIGENFTLGYCLNSRFLLTPPDEIEPKENIGLDFYMSAKWQL